MSRYSRGRGHRYTWLGGMALAVVLVVIVGRYCRVEAQAGQSHPAAKISEIVLPDGAVRTAATPDGFGAWLRNLPLRDPADRIHLHDGTRKQWQDGLYQIIDLDIGDEDLQQCADAAIRLRCDYLYQKRRYDDIAFNFTSGDRAAFRRWIQGYRPVIDGNDVTWERSKPVDSSVASYRQYLETVFMYAGSYSLSRELEHLSDTSRIAIGDLYIEGGFPGHVIIAVDVAVDTASGDRLALFAQGFTPAQDIHVIQNHRDPQLNPWYRIGDDGELVTPEWTFDWSDLYRFKK